MASNFKISLQEDNGTLNLILSGDFDQDSAREVLRVIRQNRTHTKKVFISTVRLEHANPFEVIANEWSSWSMPVRSA